MSDSGPSFSYPPQKDQKDDVKLFQGTSTLPLPPPIYFRPVNPAANFNPPPWVYKPAPVRPMRTIVPYWKDIDGKPKIVYTTVLGEDILVDLKEII